MAAGAFVAVFLPWDLLFDSTTFFSSTLVFDALALSVERPVRADLDGSSAYFLALAPLTYLIGGDLLLDLATSFVDFLGPILLSQIILLYSKQTLQF